ncbi:aldo/keto reductase [Paenibacillus xylaniclasticus]|uniref:aldo/keto reductase n=1 Tax=Paenibacillus xylaniclasticus TaxID=588083 RepID=UPI000FD93177|nr:MULTISPECIES: aldo/keto reductase [Paenibacillus]GFN32880.1 oxidoreductase [Paenibacillus curdlanolyticus]
MKYRPLGKNGPLVSVIGFGAWAVGGPGWTYTWGEQDDEASIYGIRAALDAGVTLYDTAAVYGLGHSEELLGQALHQDRSDVFIATKGGLVWDTSGNITRNGSYSSIIREAEESLRRLRTDYIDLYQLHWPDDNVPIEETVRALDKLVQDGKVRYIGLSNVSASLLDHALAVRHIDSIQNSYSIISRSIEQEVLPLCKSSGVGVLAYSPLASGLLSGSYTIDTRFAADDWRSQSLIHTGESFERNLAIVEQLKTLADELGITVAQLALAYVLAHPAATSALVGVRKPSHIETAVPAAHIKLNDDILEQIRTIAGDAPKVKAPIKHLNEISPE